MRQLSLKKGKVKTQLNKVYQKIDEEREHICSGCGRGDIPLSHSHLIPVGTNQSLECEENNIQLHCLDWGNRKGCHTKWESHNIEEIKDMNDFKENMDYVRSVDETYYYLLLNYKLKFDE